MVITLTAFSCKSSKKASKSKTNTSTAAKPPAKKPGKNDIQPYTKVITKEAVTDKGLFDVHKIDDKFFYEIPDTLFEREMLMVTRIAKNCQRHWIRWWKAKYPSTKMAKKG